MIKVEVGQPVVFQNGYSGRTYRATVSSVGRVWMQVKEDDQPSRIHRFRLDDQTDGTKYSMRARFYTLEQWAKVDAEQKAARVLSDQGITLQRDSLWKGHEIQLAELLSKLENQPKPQEGP